MCRPTGCKSCGKTTWAGCGRHIDEVKAAVPADEWCPGHEKAPGRGGWLRRIFGG